MPFSKQAHKEGPQEYTGKADDNAATPAPTRERANNTHRRNQPLDPSPNERCSPASSWPIHARAHPQSPNTGG